MNELLLRLRGEGGPVDIPEIMHEAADEITRLRTIVRVNGLRWGHTHAEIDALLSATHTSGDHGISSARGTK